MSIALIDGNNFDMNDGCIVSRSGDYVELKSYTASIFFRLGVRDAAVHHLSGLAPNPDQSWP